jgi:hypothetical protein
LDDGEICELGSHESLLLQDGIYQRLFRLQFEDLDKAFHAERPAAGKKKSQK